MRFARNARILKGQMDAAPVAAVFFLLVIFMVLASLLYTPGVPIHLPVADGLPGTDKPTVAVTVDSRGKLYFENQPIEEDALRQRLQMAVRSASEPPALVVQADRAVSYEMLVRLTMLAKEAGISEGWLATLPRAFPVSRGL
jgi:biopolymer transport protein ExbD